MALLDTAVMVAAPKRVENVMKRRIHIVHSRLT
jgi:hypothetical protein